MNYNAVLPLTIESHNYSGFMSDLWGINMSPDHNGIDGKISQQHRWDDSDSTAKLDEQ